MKVRQNSTPNLSQEFRCAGRSDTVALVALRLPTEPGTATLQHSDIYIVTNLKTRKKKKSRNTAKPGYNDIGSCYTSSITSDIQWYQIIPHF
jgi:hypothetical protein